MHNPLEPLANDHTLLGVLHLVVSMPYLPGWPCQPGSPTRFPVCGLQLPGWTARQAPLVSALTLVGRGTLPGPGHRAGESHVMVQHLLTTVVVQCFSTMFAVAARVSLALCTWLPEPVASCGGTRKQFCPLIPDPCGTTITYYISHRHFLLPPYGRSIFCRFLTLFAPPFTGGPFFVTFWLF